MMLAHEIKETCKRAVRSGAGWRALSHAERCAIDRTLRALSEIAAGRRADRPTWAQLAGDLRIVLDDFNASLITTARAEARAGLAPPADAPMPGVGAAPHPADDVGHLLPVARGQGERAP